MQQTTMIRRGMILTIHLISISTLFSPMTLAESIASNTVQNLPASIEIPLAHDSIQEAIAQAPPGSTLQLSAGTYTEILSIDKPLHIRGMGPSDTILSVNSSYNGYAIRITTEGVTIHGLTIINQGDGLYTTGIKVCADQTTIQDCSFHDTPIGIAVWNSTNTITQCTFEGCDDEGIVLLGTSTIPCSYNTIASCTFLENCDGIELQHATHNNITSCTFSKNTHAGIDAIISNNTHNTISQCTFSHNQGFGMFLAGSYQNLITHCSFSDDTISFVHASDNTIMYTQVRHIHLIDDSSVCITQCTDVEESTIMTQASSYEIITGQPDQSLQQRMPQRVLHYKFLVVVLSQMKILLSFYEHIHQLGL
jgi:parallel beta-helix repeat protein